MNKENLCTLDDPRAPETDVSGFEVADMFDPLRCTLVFLGCRSVAYFPDSWQAPPVTGCSLNVS